MPPDPRLSRGGMRRGIGRPLRVAGNAGCVPLAVGPRIHPQYEPGAENAR